VRQQPAQGMNTRHHSGQRGFMLWYSTRLPHATSPRGTRWECWPNDCCGHPRKAHTFSPYMPTAAIACCLTLQESTCKWQAAPHI